MKDTAHVPSSNGAAPEGAAPSLSLPGGNGVDVVSLAKNAALANASNPPPDDECMQTRWPHLFAFMCWRDVDQHTVKERAKLSVRVDRGGYVATLSDDYLAGSLSAVGNTFDEALGSLNRLLASPEQHWSSWRGKVPGKRVSKRPGSNA